VVAHVDLVGRGLVVPLHALVGQPAPGVGGQLTEDLRQVRGVEIAEAAQHRSRRFAARRGRRVAQRAQHAR
jgi:hypothetical protein